MLAMIWLAPKAGPDWADDILHQSVGGIFTAVLASGLLWSVVAFLLLLLIAHVTRDFGKPVRRRLSDPPLCSAYPDHPPANCVEDPPVSLAARLRLPYRVLLWALGIVLALTVGWQANRVITGGVPTVVFDAGLYESKLRNQCPMAEGWLRDHAFEINQRGCESVAGCRPIYAIYNRCKAPQAAGGDAGEVTLMQAFAVTPECAHVRFQPYYASGGGDAGRHRARNVYVLVLEPRWRDDDLQSWALHRGARTLRSTSTIGELVPQVCRIVRGEEWD